IAIASVRPGSPSESLPSSASQSGSAFFLGSGRGGCTNRPLSFGTSAPNRARTARSSASVAGRCFSFAARAGTSSAARAGAAAHSRSTTRRRKWESGTRLPGLMQRPHAGERHAEQLALVLEELHELEAHAASPAEAPAVGIVEAVVVL